MREMIPYALLDDHPMIMAGVRDALKAHPDLHCVAQAETANSFFTQLERLPKPPRVVVVDVSLPDADGGDVVQRLMARPVPIRAIALSNFEDAATAQRLVEAGARGYLPKGVKPVLIAEAIRAVDAGESYFPSAVAEWFVTSYLNGARIPPRAHSRPLALHGHGRPYPRHGAGHGHAVAPGTPAAAQPRDKSDAQLTPREQEILRLVLTGHSSTEIASMLAISPRTVENHRRHILQKTGQRTSIALFRYAERMGII